MLRTSVAALLLVGLQASFAFRPIPIARGTVFVRRSVSPWLLSEDAKADSFDASAQAKRLRAERLALQAERAALELAALELETERMRKAVRLDVESISAPEELPAVARAKEEGVSDASPYAAPLTPLNSLFTAFNSSSTGDDIARASEAKASTESPPPTSLSGSSIAQVLSGQSEAALQLSDAQIDAMRSQVFDLNTYYVTRVDQTFIGTIFRGNLRANSSLVFEAVRAKTAAVPELAGIQLLLLEDPLGLTLEALQAGEEPRPVFLALPSQATKLRQRLPELGVSLLGLFATTITTLGFSLSVYILADGGAMLAQIEQGDTAPITVALPIAIGLGALLLVHEVSHLVAARVHGMRTGVPAFLPSLQIGNFGAITKLLSFPPSRTALFDFAFSGPAVAAGFSLILYIVGLVLSVDLPVPELPANIESLVNSAVSAVPPPEPSTGAAATSTSMTPSLEANVMPLVPSGLLLSSLFLGSMAQAIIPAVASSPVVSLHPLAVIGFTSFVVNALQCLPIGRLDGGRMATAVLGQSNAGFVSGLSLTLLGV